MKWQIRLSSFSLFINNIREHILVNISTYFCPCMYRIMSLEKHCLKSFGQYFKFWYMLTNFSSLKGITNSWIVVGVTRCLGSSTLGFLCYCFSQVTVFCILSCCLCWGGVCLTIINTACYFLKCTSQLQKVLGTKAWLLTQVNCCSFCCREISPFLLLFSSFYWWCSIRDPVSTLLKSMRTNQRNREGQSRKEMFWLPWFSTLFLAKGKVQYLEYLPSSISLDLPVKDSEFKAIWERENQAHPVKSYANNAKKLTLLPRGKLLSYK